MLHLDPIKPIVLSPSLDRRGKVDPLHLFTYLKKELKMILTKVVMISMLNDKFRQSGLGVTLTSGMQSVADLNGLMKAIREYDDFTEDNDPYEEHDFGSLVWHGDKVFWKIDYYDESLSNWEDPLTAKCRRVLTVMLAEEY